MPQGALQSALLSQFIEHEQHAENGPGDGFADHLDRAFQATADQVDDRFGQLGEIGQGAFLDLAVLAIGFAQQDSGGELRLGTVSMYMGTYIQQTSGECIDLCQHNLILHGYICKRRNAPEAAILLASAHY